MSAPKRIDVAGEIEQRGELHYSEAGHAYVTVRVRVNRRTVVEATAYGRVAEDLARYREGTRVELQGRASVDHWTVVDGERHNLQRMYCKSFRPLSPNRRGQRRSGVYPVDSNQEPAS